MSKEQDFHELIEQQDDKNKAIIWDKIKDQIGNNVDVEQHSADTLVLKRSRQLTKINSIVIGVILFAVIAIITGILLWKLLPTNEMRYCKTGDYYIEETSLTMKQYGQEHKYNLLYFDYYDEWDYIGAIQYKLNANDETVCFKEDIFDSDGVMLEFYVTDNLTDMDFLDTLKALCRQSSSIETIGVNYYEETQESGAVFEYNGFKYYIKAEGEFTHGYILELVQFLLDTAN